MCMITPQRAAKKARKEIECYKILMHSLKSLNGAISYKPFKTYKGELGVRNSNNVGIITYATDYIANYVYYNKRYRNNRNVISEGFHAYLDISKAHRKTTIDHVIARSNNKSVAYVIYKAIIPIHSNYYVDEFGMIVADAIIITNETSFKEAIDNPKSV